MLFFLLMSFAALAQQEQLLEKKISLHCAGESLEQVLTRLHQQHALAFAYSDDAIPVRAVLTLSLEQQPLKMFLDKLEEEFGIGYKIMHQRIILVKAAQPLTQTIRGQVKEQTTGLPVVGASIRLPGTSPLIGAVSDAHGFFLLREVPVGRRALVVSCVGYHSRTLQGLLLGSAKELVLEVTLREAIGEMDALVITADQAAGQVQQAPALVSARSFSVEESKRFAGSLGDPARMAANLAGVTGVSDESNALIIRGNSPRGLLWRIEGIEVPNPNHFSSEGASSGVISVLSANVLDGADFFTGAFAAQYGNALSGVIDLRLRNGNNQRREHSFQLGLLGLEAATEGPLAVGSRASYLLNYRYSTLSVLDRMGVDLNRAGEFKNYQDLAFKINFPTARLGTFSLFGIGGLSRANLADTSALDDNYADMGVLGLTHQKLIGARASLRSALSWSGTHISRHDRLLSWNERVFQLEEDYKKSYARAAVALSRRFAGGHLAEAGLTYSRLFYNFYLRERDSENIQYNNVVNFRDQGGAGSGIVQAYVQAQSQIRPRLEATYGLHYLYFGLSGDAALEPRATLRWQLGSDKVISAGFGKHSKTENLQYYLARDHQQGGREVQLNRRLGFTRALHYVLAYEQALPLRNRLKVETYYQQLFNAPVQQNSEALYSAINEDSGFITDTLVNRGRGRNYGLELSLERSFLGNFYYQFNGSLYHSTFQLADGREWNTTYNGNYNLNAVAGYEFALSGDAGKKLLGINFKLSRAGGRRYIPIDLAESRLQGQQVYDLERAFEPKLPAYFRADVQLSYRVNRPKFSSEWRLDVQNAANHRNAAYYYYDVASGSVRLKQQVGLLPIFSYRIEF